jgi:hypothetical protein
LSALAKLAARLKPITAESLKASRNGDSTATGRRYWVIAIVLAALIFPYSLASYVTSSISDSIRKEFVTANDLAVKLAIATQTSTPVVPVGLTRSDVVVELQTFASTIRAIDSRASQLNWFVFRKDPFEDLRPGVAKDTKQAQDLAVQWKEKLQLPVPLSEDLGPVAADRILVYQDVRYFGQSVLDDVSVWYSAFAIYILPADY